MTSTRLTDEARKKGLEKARVVRKKRSEIKNRLKKGKTTIRALFKDKELFEEYVSGMKVLAIVSSLPGNGKMNAVKVLEELNISPHKKMGGLGKNQKTDFFKYFNISES
jgi:hypothetical protein